MSKRVASLSTLLLIVTMFLAQPRSAKADDIALVICDVALFSCPAADIVNQSLVQLIPNNLLGPNQYTVQNVAYNNALVSFNGTFVTADSGGKFIYAWGTGTATANAGAAGDFLDVSMRQSYVTVPGTWSFTELLSGNCDAAASASGSSVGFQGQVNGTNLPVLGPPGDCAISPFVFGAGPALKNVGAITQLIGGAQFAFPVGGIYPQSITLPFGDDFPDPSINFNDPNNPDNFITDTDIPAGFTQVANVPEPSTWSLLGCGICALALLRSRGRSAKGLMKMPLQ